MNHHDHGLPRRRAIWARALLAWLVSGTAANAREVLLWSRNADGRLEVRQQLAGNCAPGKSERGAGSLQRLPMPAPPGPSAFDRALERERERVTQRRAAERAARERLADAARRIETRERAEAEALEAERRASRAARLDEAGAKSNASRRKGRAKAAARDRAPKPESAGEEGPSD